MGDEAVAQREDVKDKNEILALEEIVEVSRKEDEGKNINVETLLSQYDQLDTVILETDDKKGDKEEDKKVSSSDLDITSILAKYGQLNMIKIQKVEPQETENKTIKKDDEDIEPNKEAIT